MLENLFLAQKFTIMALAAIYPVLGSHHKDAWPASGAMRRFNNLVSFNTILSILPARRLVLVGFLSFFLAFFSHAITLPPEQLLLPLLLLS